MMSLASSEMLSQIGDGKSNFPRLIFSNNTKLSSSKKGGNPDSLFH